MYVYLAVFERATCWLTGQQEVGTCGSIYTVAPEECWLMDVYLLYRLSCRRINIVRPRDRLDSAVVSDYSGPPRHECYIGFQSAAV